MIRGIAFLCGGEGREGMEMGFGVGFRGIQLEFWGVSDFWEDLASW